MNMVDITKEIMRTTEKIIIIYFSSQYKLCEMSDTRRYLFDDVLLDAQQRDGEDDEGGAEDGED